MNLPNIDVPETIRADGTGLIEGRNVVSSGYRYIHAGEARSPLLFCPSCKKYVDDSTELYCPDCGTHLVQQPISTAYSAVSSTAKATSSLWAQLSKLSPRTKLVLGIIVVAVVIGAVAAGAYHPGPNSPTGVANLPTKFTRWTDPQEGSFSVLLPQGWTAKGGVVHPDATEWGLGLYATDSTGSMGVFFVLPVLPTYMSPQQAASVLCSPTEGSLCDLNQVANIPGHTLARYYVYGYMTAQEYANPLLLNELKSLGIVKADASNIQISASPDTAQRFAFYIGSNSYSGADASITYSSGGSSYQVKADLGLNNGCVLNVCFWSAAFSGATARQQDFNTVADIYQLIIMPTFRINPQWLLSEIQNGGVQSTIIGQFSSKMQQLDYDAFQIQESATIQAGQGWVNALGGVMNMQDSSGNEYTVPSTIPNANHWWVSGSDIVWTQDSNGPSGYGQLTPVPTTG